MTALPRVVRPADGRKIELPGEHIRGLLIGPETDGALAIAESWLDPRHGTTEHKHHRSGEFFYVLEGTVTFDIDGEEIVTEPGSALWVPPGVSHRISNLGESVVRLLGLFAPSGPEMLFRGMQELHERTQGAPTPEQIAEAVKEYDIEHVGPSRFAPAD